MSRSRFGWGWGDGATEATGRLRRLRRRVDEPMGLTDDSIAPSPRRLSRPVDLLSHRPVGLLSPRPICLRRQYCCIYDKRMFCATCNLHYPDHLNFCRRCGQTLTRSSGEPVTESVCCTRCGARVVRGENFCQQCGYRTSSRNQETVVGACIHCGTSWRNGWLFCKNCGLDRDRALMSPVSTPASPSSLTASAAATLEEIPVIEKLHCPHCGAESKPFSRFCEACGKPVTVVERGVAASGSPQTLLDEPVDNYDYLSADADRGEDLGGEPETAAEEVESIGREATVELPPRKTTGIGKTESPPARRAPVRGSEAASPRAAFPRPADSVVLPTETDARGQRAAFQTVALIGLLLLAVGAVAAWWFLRYGSRPTASLSQPAQSQPTVETTTAPAPSPAPTEAPTPSTAVAVPEGMVYVPGGTFQMGRNRGDRFERPAHDVTVDSFFIDRTEVTNEDYQRFVIATSHPAPSHWIDGKMPEGEARYPVVNVSWSDASAYAQWANKRLPTEAEWEFAARGTDGRLYPWGDEWNEGAANAAHAGNNRPAEVGHFNSVASPFGALDMSGNVWEWTSSNLVSYADQKKSLAPGKVVRGGAFDVPQDRATTTYRGVLQPEKVYDKTGFRCVRSVN